MDKFTFHYKKSSLHIIQLVVFGLLGLLFLFFAVSALQELAKSTGADRDVFMWLALGMGLAGTAFIGFGCWYFFRIKNFYKSNEWFGVEITSLMISCRYFDFLSRHYWETPLADIISFRQDSYKGRVFIALKTPQKRFVIPLNNLDAESSRQLVYKLSQLIK